LSQRRWSGKTRTADRDNGRVNMGEGGADDRALQVRAVPGMDEVIRAATRHYLRGEPIDMSSLAAELGMGRATLYRRVGNREWLVGLVLADRTEHTYREASAGVGERRAGARRARPVHARGAGRGTAQTLHRT
jgi:hypothetical protein